MTKNKEKIILPDTRHIRTPKETTPIIVDHLFPIPLYRTNRVVDLDSLETKDIDDIIEAGMRRNFLNSFSKNTHIFDTKLYNLKNFCEKHIKTYVEELINPTEELDFYITQSWLNITKPGESHQPHWHSNSIISGVFYVSTVENDRLYFYDPNYKTKRIIELGIKEYDVWNSAQWSINISDNVLVLFPSWIDHFVEPNEKQTKDRISLSFNTFAKGFFGSRGTLNELIL